MEDNEKHMRDIEDTVGRSNISTIGVPGGVEGENEAEAILNEVVFETHKITHKICLDEKTGPLCTGAKPNLED